MDTSDERRIAEVVTALFDAGYQAHFTEPATDADEWLAEAWPITSGAEPLVVDIHALGDTEASAAEALFAAWQRREQPL